MIFYGSLAILIAYIASKLGDLLRPTLSIAATYVGPFMGIFLAAWLKKSTLYGVMIGGFVAFVLTTWICIGQINFSGDYDNLEGLDYLYGLSYLLLAPIGVVLSFILSMVFSGFDHCVNKLRN